jgi:hypothetical protein
MDIVRSLTGKTLIIFVTHEYNSDLDSGIGEGSQTVRYL